MSIVYGPVPSWRLGRSLGIDIVSTDAKTCSFDCIYCQLGKTVNRQAGRTEFIQLNRLQKELDKLPALDVDYATFSGVGEPTLASNIGPAIQMVKQKLHLPIAVLTNSSLLHEKAVREDLAGADVVVVKLDAPDNDLLNLINNPVLNLPVQTLIEGIRSFRSIFSGKLAIQIMFIETNRNKSSCLAELVKEIAPDEVQINTPLRPCSIKPLSRPDLLKISESFSGLKNVITVYQETKPITAPFNHQQTERRRPGER